jgi:hypothetical protein
VTSHSYHPDVHEFGLQPDCERCWQLAERPLQTLDDRMLASLRDRVQNGLQARTQAERWAMTRLMESMPPVILNTGVR